MVANIIRAHQDDMAHCGPEKIIQKISNTYWFPLLRKRAHDYITDCLACLIANPATNSREIELQIEEIAKLPFDRVYIDHFGPLPKTSDKYQYVVVIVDAFTRYTWLFPTQSTTSKEVKDRLKVLFIMFGSSKKIRRSRTEEPRLLSENLVPF